MNSRDWALSILTVIAILLAGAQYMEHILLLDPCPLCMMQRVWFILVGLIACLGLATNPRLRIYPLLSLLGALTGGGFSIRQLYLQSLPPDEVPLCGPDLAYMLDVFPLSDTLNAMIMGGGSCAQVNWSFLGLSIAAYALLGFIALAAFSVAQWKASNIPL